MNIDILEKYHFPNLSASQLKETIDFGEVWALPEHADSHKALELLSQYLVGNVSETFKEIKAMDSHDRRRLLHSWAKVVKDAKELQSILISVSQELF